MAYKNCLFIETLVRPLIISINLSNLHPRQTKSIIYSASVMRLCYFHANAYLTATVVDDRPFNVVHLSKLFIFYLTEDIHCQDAKGHVRNCQSVHDLSDPGAVVNIPLGSLCRIILNNLHSNNNNVSYNYRYVHSDRNFDLSNTDAVPDVSSQ